MGGILRENIIIGGIGNIERIGIIGKAAYNTYITYTTYSACKSRRTFVRQPIFAQQNPLRTIFVY